MNAALRRFALVSVVAAFGCAGAPAPAPVPTSDPAPSLQSPAPQSAVPALHVCKLDIVHDAVDCLAAARRERCVDLHHWCVWVDGRPFADWRVLRGRLHEIARTQPEDGVTESTFTSRTEVELRADVDAPYAVVQRAIQLCGSVGLYRVQCFGQPEPAGPLREFTENGAELRIALFWDAEHRETVAMIDDELLRDLEHLHALVRGFSDASRRAKAQFTLFLDAAVDAPWGEVLLLARLGRGAKVEFAAVRKQW